MKKARKLSLTAFDWKLKYSKSFPDWHVPAQLHHSLNSPALWAKMSSERGGHWNCIFSSWQSAPGTWPLMLTEDRSYWLPQCINLATIPTTHLCCSKEWGYGDVPALGLQLYFGHMGRGSPCRSAVPAEKSTLHNRLRSANEYVYAM